MKLFHTSPSIINEIYEDGTFGSHVFFSDHEYVMTEGDYVTYLVDIDEKDVVAASSLFYQDNWKNAMPTVQKVMDRIAVEQDIAMNLIDGTLCLMDISEMDSDDDFWIQKMQAEAAQLMGYNAVAVKDETGISYMLDLKVYKEKMELLFQ
jgi:hypothetical protein